MTVICLTHGRYALIDDEDWEWVNQWKWHVTQAFGKWYVRRCPWIKEEKKQIGIFLHREIMRATQDMFVDHRNGDPLDNRKENLRVCTVGQNNANAVISVRNVSGFKGVSRTEQGRWRVKVSTRYVGTFTDLVEAACAYDREAVKQFGEFALTNKSMGLL